MLDYSLFGSPVIQEQSGNCNRPLRRPVPEALRIWFVTRASLYVLMTYMPIAAMDRELKRGSTELLILSLVEYRARHGYEISKLIEDRSGGVLTFNVASFYPLLYRLEQRGLIAGRWVEKAGQRRRRYYKLTPSGKKMLKAQRSTWREFVEAIQRITEAEHA